MNTAGGRTISDKTVAWNVTGRNVRRSEPLPLGSLEVSRAFGDRQFKKVGVVATLDIHSFDLAERDQFIILGCDSLWGLFGPSDAVEFVHKLLKKGVPVTAVSRRLVCEAVRERRCRDNCTAVIVVFGKK